MNPLAWKREHQVALLICAGIGLMFGLMFGMHEVDKYGPLYFLYGWSDSSGSGYHSIDFYWAAVGLVGIFGALISGAIIYAIQLMRH
jgi:hypothetical protein